MAETTVTTPYATAMPYVVGVLPTWTDEYDAQRLASYDFYDDMYRNSAASYQLMLRGSDDEPVYVPTAKKIINTIARYVGRGWGFSVDRSTGTPAEQEAAIVAFGDLFNREEVLSKFASGKKEWLRRGDWVWMLSADPDKAEGARISVNSIDPRTYFPIFDENDPTRIVGARIIEEFVREDDNSVEIKVQRWLKPTHPEHPDFEALDHTGSSIYYDAVTYKLEDWDDPDKRTRLEELSAPIELTGILTLPFYHVKNNAETENPFGVSDLSGLESIVSGINQSVSDESMALALSGLGMYWTDSGAPVNPATNEEEDWILGPNRVVEVGQGRKFNRVQGVASVDPSQTHIGYLERNAYAPSGVNDVALGETDGAVAASGIALAIKMQPLFDACDEKDLALHGKLNQMFYDLKTWFLIYEGVNLGEATIISSTDKASRLPFDREARYKELLDGYAAGVFSLEFVQSELTSKFGYTFPAGMLTATQSDNAKKAAQADPYGARVAAEIGAGDGSDDAE